MNRESRAGPIVLGLGVVIPGLIVSGFMPEVNVLPLLAWAGIAALAGAVGVALHTRRRLGLSALLGALGGFGSLFAIPYYVDFRGQFGLTFFTIEFLIPCGLVSLPLFGVWHAVTRAEAR